MKHCSDKVFIITGNIVKGHSEAIFTVVICRPFSFLYLCPLKLGFISMTIPMTLPAMTELATKNHMAHDMLVKWS